MRTNSIIISLCIILLAMLVMLPVGPIWMVNHTAPLRLGVYSAFQDVHEYWSWIGDVRTLAAERDALVKERNQLSSKVARLDEVTRENEDLRQQLKVSKNSQQKTILAKSAGLVDRASAKYLLINKGKGDGVKNGQLVVSDGVLVGRIFQVEANSSLVELPLTANAIIPAMIRYEDSVTKGVVKANFNLTVHLEQVLQNEKLEQNTLIVTSGEGGTYPANLVVGKVGKVNTADDQAFKSASVELLWDIFKLENVFIVQ